MKPKATLKKIAEKLQISISTVSRALKDHPDISLETRKKVREFAEMMEYEPNTMPSVCVQSQQSILRSSFRRLQFYQSFISAVEEESRLHGYSLMILQSGDNPETELDNLKLCRQNRVAGLFVSITIKTTDIRAFLKMEDLDVPVIFLIKCPILRLAIKYV
jgi:LacI family transcriptional regulator